MPVKRRTKVKPKWSGKELRTFRRYLRRVVTPYSETSIGESTSSDFAMDNTSDNTASDAKKRKFEARMVPGLIPNKVYGFPNSIITTMRYAEVFTKTSTLGAIAFNTFNANSIFDPNATGVGHQPMYKDQWSGIYNQYVVIGSKITVHFASQDSKNWVVGVCGDDDSLFPTALTDKMEMNNSVYTLIAGQDVRTLTMTYEPNADLGVDAISDGASQTAVGANPTELFCFGVWGHVADASLTGKFDFTVEIEYTVKFSELSTPIPS